MSRRDDSVLHFATIVTPDADPLKRRGMLDVLEQFFRPEEPGAPQADSADDDLRQDPSTARACTWRIAAGSCTSGS